MSTQVPSREDAGVAARCRLRPERREHEDDRDGDECEAAHAGESTGQV